MGKIAPGPDNLPRWFLKLAAPLIAKQLVYLYNLSLFTSYVPTQFKSALISSIPKATNPALPAEYRPISLTPIISKLFEKQIVRTFIHPAFDSYGFSDMLSDQIAFKPIGSIEVALITILHF